MAPERGEDEQGALLDAALVEAARNLAGPAVIVDGSSRSAASAERFAQLVAGVARHDVVVVPSSHPTRRAPKARMFLRFARAPRGSFLGSSFLGSNPIGLDPSTSEPD
ncbi:MAG: hypothetical protein R6X02_05270 [Enhygromyxa sp.]